MSYSQIDHRMVQVNAAQRSEGSVSNFSTNFLTRDLDNVKKVVMIKATLPRLFFNIQSWNNTINIIHPANTPNVFIIPVGQYTATTLAAAMTTATAGINTAWAYNAATSRIRATYSGVTTANLDPLSSIAPYIGLMATITLGAPSDMQSPPQLSGPDEILVISNLVATSSCVAAGNTTAKSLLGNINFTNVPYGFTGRWDAQQSDIAHIDFPYSVCMRKIDVRLEDVFGHQMELPDNCYLDMTLQFQY